MNNQPLNQEIHVLTTIYILLIRSANLLTMLRKFELFFLDISKAFKV